MTIAFEPEELRKFRRLAQKGLTHDPLDDVEQMMLAAFALTVASLMLNDPESEALPSAVEFVSDVGWERRRSDKRPVGRIDSMEERLAAMQRWASDVDAVLLELRAGKGAMAAKADLVALQLDVGNLLEVSKNSLQTLARLLERVTILESPQQADGNLAEQVKLHGEWFVGTGERLKGIESSVANVWDRLAGQYTTLADSIVEFENLERRVKKLEDAGGDAAGTALIGANQLRKMSDQIAALEQKLGLQLHPESLAATLSEIEATQGVHHAHYKHLTERLDAIDAERRAQSMVVEQMFNVTGEVTREELAAAWRTLSHGREDRRVPRYDRPADGRATAEAMLSEVVLPGSHLASDMLRFRLASVRRTDEVLELCLHSCDPLPDKVVFPGPVYVEGKIALAIRKGSSMLAHAYDHEEKPKEAGDD